MERHTNNLQRRFPPSPETCPCVYVGWARLQLNTVLRSTLAQSKQWTRFHRRKHSWAETGMENRADRKQRPQKWTTRRGWWVGMGAESTAGDHLRKEESSKYSKVKKRHICVSPEPKKASRALFLRTCGLWKGQCWNTALHQKCFHNNLCGLPVKL